MCTSPNSGHTATLCSAQIQPYGWISHVRRTLYAIRHTCNALSKNIEVEKMRIKLPIPPEPIQTKKGLKKI